MSLEDNIFDISVKTQKSKMIILWLGKQIKIQNSKPVEITN